MMKERRKELRKIDESEILIEAMPGQDGIQSGKASGLLQNLSLNGMKVCIDRFYPVGTKVRVEVKLYKRGNLRLEGKIIWTHDLVKEKLIEAGINFFDPAPAGVMALISHLYGKGCQ